MIGLLVGLVHRTLFYMGERGLRRAHPAAKIPASALFLASSIAAPLETVAAVAAAGIAGYGAWWAAAAVGLSSIPAAWYALTALALGAAGFTAPVSPVDALWIFLRTLSLSAAILVSASMVSPLEIHAVLHRLGSRRSSVTPILVWRLVPAALHGFEESLAVGRAKGDPVYARLGPAAAYMIEYGEMIYRAQYHRLHAAPAYPVLPRYTARASIILLASSVFAASSALLHILLS